jgi:hypothetical protein
MSEGAALTRIRRAPRRAVRKAQEPSPAVGRDDEFARVTAGAYRLRLETGSRNGIACALRYTCLSGSEGDRSEFN